MNLSRVLWLFLVLSLALSACNINNEPLGVRRELVDEGDLGKILKKAFRPAPDDTTLSRVLNTGRSPYLVAGEIQNLTGEILLAFSKIAGIKQAKLVLPVHLVAGPGSSFNPSVHRVTRAWQEDTVTAKNFQISDYDPMPVGRAVFPSLDSLRKSVDKDTLAFVLDSTYVQRLANDSVNVLIRMMDPGLMLELHSRQNGVKAPFLEILQTRAGKADTTLRFAPLADAFIFRRALPLPEDRLYVGNGERRLTYLRFSTLDSLPANATVNRAILTLHIDREHTFINQDGLVSAGFLVNADSLKVPKPDSLYFSLIANATSSNTLSKDADMAEFNLTLSAQAWINSPEINGGLTIEPTAAFWDLQRVAFHTAASNPALAPKLTLDYTTPPGK